MSSCVITKIAAGVSMKRCGRFDTDVTSIAISSSSDSELTSEEASARAWALQSVEAARTSQSRSGAFMLRLSCERSAYVSPPLLTRSSQHEADAPGVVQTAGRVLAVTPPPWGHGGNPEGAHAPMYPKRWVRPVAER